MILTNNDDVDNDNKNYNADNNNKNYNADNNNNNSSDNDTNNYNYNDDEDDDSEIMIQKFFFFSSPYPYVKFNCKDYILLTEKAAYIVWYLNLKILCTAHLLFECGEPRRRKKSNNNSKVIILAFSAPKNYVHQLIKVVFWQFCFFKN